MSASGARVLQLRSVEYARNHGVRIHCRSSFEDGPGTLVVAEEETVEQPFVTAVTHSDAEARVTLTGVRDEPGVAGRIFTALAEANVNVDVIIQNEPVGDDELADLSFTVDRSDLTAATDTIAGLGGSASGVQHRRADRQGLDRRRRHALAPRRRRQGLRGARRRGDQHRDDLHLADQDLVRDLRRPASPTRSRRCTRPSTSAPTRSGPRTRPAASTVHGRTAAGHLEMRDGYRVGVLGATGAVGSTILERPRRARASRPPRWSRSPPSARPGKRARVERLACWSAGALSEETIQGLDIVLSSAGGAVSAEWAPRLVEAGAVVVDNTSFWRMHDDVPLVVAGVNPDAAAAHQRDRRQPELHDDGDDDGAGADPPRRRPRAARRLQLPGRLRHRAAGDRGAARAVGGGARRRGGPARRRSTRTGSPSTSCPRSRSSRTATTTRPRSAR